VQHLNICRNSKDNWCSISTSVGTARITGAASQHLTVATILLTVSPSTVEYIGIHIFHQKQQIGPGHSIFLTNFSSNSDKDKTSDQVPTYRS
jgi:hypothetical protein